MSTAYTACVDEPVYGGERQRLKSGLDYWHRTSPTATPTATLAATPTATLMATLMATQTATQTTTPPAPTGTAGGDWMM